MNDAFQPTLLVSMPQLQDPNFTRSVVLLCDYLPDGAFVTSDAAGHPRSDSIAVRATATLAAQLLWKGALWEWSPAAYGSPAQV